MFPTISHHTIWIWNMGSMKILLYFNLIVTNCFEAFRKYFKIRMQKRISWNPYGPLALGAAAPVCSPGVLLLPAGEGARWEGGCYLLLLRSFHQKSRKPWKWSAASKFIIRKSDVERKWIAVHVIFSWCHANLIRLTTLSSTSLRTRFWWLRRARTTCWWGGKPDLQMWDSPQGSWTNSEKIEKSLRYQLHYMLIYPNSTPRPDGFGGPGSETKSFPLQSPQA